MKLTDQQETQLAEIAVVVASLRLNAARIESNAADLELAAIRIRQGGK